MIPVPDYLSPYAQIVKTSKTWSSFTFSCICGCHSFIPFVNYYTLEEETAMKPYYDALNYCFTGAWASTCTKDDDGTLHRWKLFTPAGLDGPKEEVFIPDKPFFANIMAVKIKCTHCGEDHLIFDSRYHGYDGMTGTHTEEVLNYQPHFRAKCRSAVGIEIKVENDPSLESFEENTGIRFTEMQYSNAFSFIKIYAVNPDGKKRMIFECETA